ncbi:hypothetical protein THAOC_26737, partial [Thalassiosira oceanica]
HGEGDEAILDRNWLGLVKAEITNLLKLGFLLGPRPADELISSEKADIFGKLLDALNSLKPVNTRLRASEVASPNPSNHEPASPWCFEDGATCTASSARTAPVVGGQPPIDIGPSSSILDFFDDSLLEDDVLADIRENLLAGRLVVIRDAFKPEFAEHVHSVLTGDDMQWIHKKRSKDTDLQRHNIVHHTIDSQKIVDIFNSTKTRELVTRVSGRSCMGHDAEFRVSDFKPGDHISHHTDFHNKNADLRSTNLVWNLSKDWQKEWGGAFYWAAANRPEVGYHFPTFNTVFIFIPNELSTHLVTPIADIAKGRRLTVNVKYSAEDLGPYSIERPIEDLYGRKEDHILLTKDEATWITRTMNPHNAEPEERCQKLWDLKDSVAKNYMNPEHDAVYIVEDGENDGGDDDDGEDEVIVTKDTSILDVLDPSLLADDELMGEIRDNLRAGKLVVVKQAFKRKFAERVWEMLDNQVSGTAAELRNAMGVIDHPETSAFFEELSGRRCRAKRAQWAWFRRGHYSDPHNDFGSRGHTHKNGLGNRKQDTRTLGFIWWLAKDWSPGKERWGGRFVWYPSKVTPAMFNKPGFNELFLFLPTASSVHSVEHVEQWSKSKLLSIISWFHAGVGEYPVANINQLEDLARAEDWNKLSYEQAKFIADEMNPALFTADVSRQSLLIEMKEKVTKQYLYPSDDSAFYIDWELEEP